MDDKKYVLAGFTFVAGDHSDLAPLERVPGGPYTESEIYMEIKKLGSRYKQYIIFDVEKQLIFDVIELSKIK